MRLTPTVLAGRVLPKRIYDIAEPALEQADAALAGSDEQSRTRRVALKAFAIRIVGAALAYATQVLLARWLGRFDYGIEDDPMPCTLGGQIAAPFAWSRLTRGEGSRS